jgi:hypothetical protein
MKTFGRMLIVALFGYFAAASLSHAAPAKGSLAVSLLAAAPVVTVDWQEPQSLPRRLRNHCAIDTFSGRPYCSDHCGYEYQVYSCSHGSFGCCRVGFGYCDWNGILRCHP